MASTNSRLDELKQHFTFVPSCDQMGNDIQRNQSQNKKTETYEGYMENALKMGDKCEAFNTMGYYKSRVAKLEPSPHFQSNDGIYVKKRYTDAVYVCGCVKSCAKFLNFAMQNVRILTSFFYNFKIVIVFDKSSDHTLDILKHWQKIFGEDKFIIIMGNNKSYLAVENITNARNTLLQYIRDEANPLYKYFIMMDMDNACTGEIKLNVFHEILSKEEVEKWDAITFNLQDYYDIWALSIDDYLCSLWHFEGPKMVHLYRIKQYVQKRLKDAVTTAPSATSSEKYVPCVSAFNGFGIYKIDKFIHSHYECKLPRVLKFINAAQIKQNEIALGNHRFNVCSLNNSFNDCEHRFFHMYAKHYDPTLRIYISPHILFNDPLPPVSAIDRFHLSISDTSSCMCEYVSSRGLMESCNVYQNIWYKHGDELCSFIKSGGKFKVKTILITGDCDDTFPSDFFRDEMEFRQFIEQPKLIHWFSQNCDSSPLHPKMTRMPIGLDYHTLQFNKIPEWGPQTAPVAQECQLKDIPKRPYWERQLKCYGNFQFQLNTRYGKSDRNAAMREIPAHLMYYEPQMVPRLESWKKQTEFAFVISPLGNGYDCHRTWEAMLLGCIPIVRHNPIEALFNDLPVLFVNEWSEVTEELLRKTVQEFSQRQFNFAKLGLNYWVHQIMDKIKYTL